MVSLFLLSPPPLAPVIGTHEGEKFNIWPSTDLSPSLPLSRGRKEAPATRCGTGDDKRGEEGRCRARQIKSEQPAASLFTEGYLRH